MLPFDNLVATRLQKRDQHRPCIPKPISEAALLPAPSAFDATAPFDQSEDAAMGQLVGSIGYAFNEFGGAATAGAPSGYVGVEGTSLGVGAF